MRERNSQSWSWTLRLLPCLALTGCNGVVNIFGVYFPAWMASFLVGLALTGVTLSFLSRSALREILPHPAVSFLSLMTFYSILAWFILFRD